MSLTKRIFVAGHRGMVGSAIVRQLQQQSNIFATLAGASPGMATQQFTQSPALTAAQAFGTVYGGLGSIFGRNA